VRNKSQVLNSDDVRNMIKRDEWHEMKKKLGRKALEQR
jgi:hypothetical protein